MDAIVKIDGWDELKESTMVPAHFFYLSEQTQQKWTKGRQVKP